MAGLSPEMMTTVVQLVVALCGALAVVGLMTMLAPKEKDRLGELLKRDKAGPSRLAEERAKKKNEEVKKKIAKVVEEIGKNSAASEKDMSQIKLDLINAGFRSPNAVSIFMGVKLIFFLTSVAVVVPLVYTNYGFTTTGILYMAIGAAIGMIAPSFFLGYLKSRRQEQIFLTLPDALDLMVVCVEAGLGLDAAFNRIASELQTAAPVLCEEFAIANFQIRMGRPRREVLRDLGVRTGVADLRALAAVLIQAERFGSSIASALRVQSDSMRIKRRQIAEEKAAKTAVKLLFPLVLFIFPGIFVVLVGPAAISIKQNLVQK
ncbi:Type II secretion system F domain protein [Isosphaera pallida ATCC 43644]|jgi:tight adherence protein C|uniref:Type II secretion system F domain protein n=1 Tax=Isosphaera pallida (strain ATCC 43644 / DSM 9630 / IS1B) TaxID=575540 RepID=E8R642_ISOPI|nr:type II secretion system F family protein [Isosphaera pallida]ADV60737.1 Type II secretion system F domain protein [Isosphaera pallida ATCC 43644]